MWNSTSIESTTLRSHSATNRADWFLTADERGNSVCSIDRRHGPVAWTANNLVVPLVHGRAYFARLYEVLNQTLAGDQVLFTDWRGDPDERLAGPGRKRLMCSSDWPNVASMSRVSCGGRIPTSRVQ